MTSTHDQEHNLGVCSQLAAQASEAGCRMLCLPECFAFMGDSSMQSPATVAQPLNGPLMSRYKQLARDNGLWLSLGGFQEAGPDADHIHNCHIIIKANGETAATYRKIHLCDVEVPGGQVWKESSFTSPGCSTTVCESPVGKLGLSVCYDLRFPQLYQELRFRGGADVLLIPSAFTKPTGSAHFELLLRSRAIECQCYVIAAAQAGQNHANRQSWGHSCVIDPWGKVLARMDDKETGIAVAEIDSKYVADIRKRMPIATHRSAGRSSLMKGGESL
ncbi:unnamed protein product [Ostreobium quekettii]|uniref:CN hydrolase domain-containing protein n=1 Tax=Ostreobium quekettii TaxID=121088 RepID=A0A8S1IUJ4_9CHLO|nr:unnamed protein product [Ostreobium quekettii]